MTDRTFDLILVSAAVASLAAFWGPEVSARLTVRVACALLGLITFLPRYLRAVADELGDL